MNDCQQSSKVLKIGKRFKIFMEKVLLVSHNMVQDFIEISLRSPCIVIKLGDFVIFCCDIPHLTNPSTDLIQFHNDYLLLLQSENNGSCVVSLAEKKVHFWSDAVEVIVDDYFCVGHDQIIVSFGKDKLLATDFKCCDFDTRSQGRDSLKDCNNEVSNDKPPNSAVASALNKNILHMRNKCQLLESNNMKKQYLIQRSYQSFVNMSLDMEAYTSPKLSSLVPLFHKINTVTLPEAKSTKQQFQGKFQVTKKWFRKFCMKLVLGCTVRNDNEDSFKIENVSLGASLVNAGATSCKSTIHFPSKCKDSKSWKSGNENLFMLAFDFPSLANISSLKICLKLTYTLYQKPHKTFCVFIDNFEVSRLDFLVMDCITMKHYENRDQEDNAAFEFALYKRNFALTSKITNVKTMYSILARRLNCHETTVGNVTVLATQSPRAEIRFQPGYRKSFGTIFATMNDDVVCLLHEIDQIKPADVSFEYFVDTGKAEKVCEQLLRETKRHISVIKNELQKHGEKADDDVIILLDTPEKNQAESQATNFCEENAAEILQTDLLVSKLFLQ